MIHISLRDALTSLIVSVILFISTASLKKYKQSLPIKLMSITSMRTVIDCVKNREGKTLKFLAISNTLSLSKKQLQIIEDTRFSYCVFLGDVSENCMIDIHHIVGCDSYAILGEKDAGIVIPNDIHRLHNKCFSVNDKIVGGFEYSENFNARNSWNDKYVDPCILNANILFTHHSPVVRFDLHGNRIMPDYISYVAKIINPTLNICGHGQQNSIGSISEYKCDPIKIININGIAMIQTNDKLQIDKLIML